MTIDGVWIPVLPVAIALAAAAAMHAALRLAERWEAGKPGRSRDMVMLPFLLVLALAVAAGADRLDATDPDLLAQAGFAGFLGLAIGQALPRPPRRRR